MPEIDARKLPLSQAVIYASGYFGVYLISFSVATIPQIFYVPEEGAALIRNVTIGGSLLLGGYLFGLLNALGRIVDGVVDPWIGNISDHWRSRWGRRRPLIAFGTPLMAIFLILFTTPPTSEPSLVNIAWLAVIYPLFFLFYTIAITPYLAMIPEITRTPSERLLVTTLQSIFLILGTFAAVVIIGFMPEHLPFTEGTTLIAVLSCVPLLIVAAFVENPREMEVVEAKRPSTMSQIRDALSFTPFRIYLLSMVTFFFGFVMIENSARYVAVHLFGDESAYTPMLSLTLGVAAISGIGAYWLGKKIGKKRSMILMSLMFAVLLPFVGLIGRGFLASWTAGYILYALMGIPISILLVIPNSLLADIIDLDTETTGKRREALYFASQALLNKIGIAFSKVTMNFILPIGLAASVAEKHAVGETGVRLLGPIAAFFILIGLLIFTRLPDVEKR
jgi:GPH family glycoside/pentoside/hexuronide:cation symporter